MINKIKIGEYVRNESGYINKINSFDRLTNFFKDDDGKLKEWIGEDIWGNTIAESIVKHSKNIIDLIEVGDYVNGERVFKIEKDPFVKGQTNIYFNRDEVNYWGDRSLSQITDKNIKSILTKEQFESMKYEVK